MNTKLRQEQIGYRIMALLLHLARVDVYCKQKQCRKALSQHDKG